MSFVRSTIALILLLAAVGVGLVGLGSHWVDRVARTPAPVRGIGGPGGAGDQVVRVIASELETAAVAEIPELAEYVPGLQQELTGLIGLAIDRALADERVNRAWFSSIDMTRTGAVSALDAMREQGEDAPTIWFPLGPFVELGEQQLYELADPRMHQYLDQLQWPKDLSVPLGRPETQPALRVAEALGVAQNWRLYYGAAAALAVAGLLIGSRRGRWVALLMAAAVGVAALFVGRQLPGFFPVPPANTISGAIQARIITGSTASVNRWIDTALLVGYGVLAFAVIGLIVAAALARRRPTGPHAA